MTSNKFENVNALVSLALDRQRLDNLNVIPDTTFGYLCFFFRFKLGFGGE